VKNKFKTQGVWKKLEQYPNSRAICLQLVIATQPNEKGEIAGIVGGYCGNNLFALEQFFAKTLGNKLSALWIGSEDVKNSLDVDFNDLSPQTLNLCHQALEECWEWNSENNWLEAQQLRLYPYCLEGLKHNKAILETKKDKLLSDILKYAQDTLGLVDPKHYQIQNNNTKIKKSKEINL
jgi:hypothetical protein